MFVKQDKCVFNLLMQKSQKFDNENYTYVKVPNALLFFSFSQHFKTSVLSDLIKKD